MKLTTWNVNGLRACLNKGFLEYCEEAEPDIICLQETKMQQGQAEVNLKGYEEFWNSAEKKGYSGTAVFTKEKPLWVGYDIDAEGMDREGRAITLEFDRFYLVTEYTPNAQEGLARIDFRMEWEDAFLRYVKKLDASKPVVICGDLNVAHQEIDLKNPASNRGHAGFSDQEREKFGQLLDTGFADTFRSLYPDKTEAYTWWSYRFNARARNAGWRIDYFLVSQRLLPQVKDVIIRNDRLGSDHCPVELLLEV